MIAALFVEKGGCYWGLPNVDPWDKERDARLYAGPWPVVAHPPCSRWCRLAGLVQKRWGYKKGDDGGAFESALNAVRRWGGVLEHPAFSDAWAAFGLPRPHRYGGWQGGLCGGSSAHIEQWHWGHRAKKATWIYTYGCDLPSMHWGSTPDNALTAYVTDGGGDVKRRAAKKPPALISWCGNHIASGETRPRLGAKEASATPHAFRDLLIRMAESANQPEAAR